MGTTTSIVRAGTRSFAASSHTGLPPSRSLLPDQQFRLQAKVNEQRTALVEPNGSKVTFGELDARIERYAAGLLSLGLQTGQAFGIRLPNCADYLALVLASARAGLVHAALNERLAQAEVDYAVEAGELALIVGAGGITPEALGQLGGEQRVDVAVDELMPLHLRFSSGTTGKQKVSLSTHRNVGLFNLLVGRELGHVATDVQLAVAPLTHMAGSLALSQITAGGQVVIREKFDAERLWRDCEEQGITNVAVVPTIIASSLASPGDPSALRTVVSMGAPLAVSLKHELTSRFPQAGLFEMYGSSEMGMVTCLRPEHQLQRPESVGRASFGYELLIADEHGAPLPPGEVGDVYTRGTMTHTGYVGSERPPAVPASLAAGDWMTVGDLGHLDEDGFLYLSVRRTDLILSGGFNVYPAEVEQAIGGVEGVTEVAVVGAEDERWGQRVVAFVVAPAETREAIEARCRVELAGYKQPRELRFVDELPKGPTGKVIVRHLREAASAGTDAA